MNGLIIGGNKIDKNAKLTLTKWLKKWLNGWLYGWLKNADK
jgi:hypothetical protein